MSEEILPVHSMRKKTAQHVLAALMLVTYALDHLSRPHTGVPLLPIVEIAAAILLVAAVVRERLHKAHGGIAWVEFAGALMALVESIDRTEGRYHLSFIILSYFAPVVLFVFALFDARISAAHYLKADDERFELRLRLLFRRCIRWVEIRAFRIAGSAIECELARGGSRRFSLRRVTERDAALAWSAEQFRRRGTPESAQ